MAEKQSQFYKYKDDLIEKFSKLDKSIFDVVKQKIEGEFEFVFGGENNIIKYLNSDDFLNGE